MIDITVQVDECGVPYVLSLFHGRQKIERQWRMRDRKRWVALKLVVAYQGNAGSLQRGETRSRRHVIGCAIFVV